MTDDRMALIEALQKADDGNFLRSLAETVLHPHGGRRGGDDWRRALRAKRRAVDLAQWLSRPDARYPASAGHKIYPYLLRNLARPNQVWTADITYVPIGAGVVYPVAIVDWFSRCVLAWRLSITLSADFCVEAPGGGHLPAWQAGNLQHGPGKPGNRSIVTAGLPAEQRAQCVMPA